MLIFSVGVVLIVVSLILFVLSYRMYSYRGLLQDGYVFVRVLYLDKKCFGWVRKNSIRNLDRIDLDKFQWFIELYGREKTVIKIETIKEIKRVSNPVLVCLKSSIGKEKIGQS